MNPSTMPLSARQIALFRALVKPAAAYLLMLRLGRPTTTREVAGILAIPEGTADRYMHALQSLGLVAWDKHKNHYKLVDRHQHLLYGDESRARHVREDRDREGEHGLFQEPANEPQSGASQQAAQVWQELFSAGVSRNPRTRALVRRPYITPEYVRAHRLKLIASGKNGPKWAGLLVTILEGGDPAPPLNPNGHLEDCECLDCHRYRISRSWEDF